MNDTTQPPAGLVDGYTLLKELFDERCRPGIFWVREQCRLRTIPFVRMGRRVWFNVAAVRQAIDERHTVQKRAIK